MKTIEELNRLAETYEETGEGLDEFKASVLVFAKDGAPMPSQKFAAFHRVMESLTGSEFRDGQYEMKD